MRILGALVFVLATAATAYLAVAIDRKGRPVDVALAVLAPLALLIALIGLVLVFVPDFFG